MPLGQLLLVLVLLTRVFAPEHLSAGLLPTPTSIADLGRLLADGTAEIQEQATPALPLSGLVALTTVFVGLVALAVDLLAVPARQPALGGLGAAGPLLRPGQHRHRQRRASSPSPRPAAGFAVLLWADQRARLADGARGGSGSAAGHRHPARAAHRGGRPGRRRSSLPLFVPTLAEGSLASGLGGAGHRRRATAPRWTRSPRWPAS